jgi:hypothetical protein
MQLTITYYDDVSIEPRDKTRAPPDVKLLDGKDKALQGEFLSVTH